MRMMWWFIILGLSGTVLAIAVVAIFARVRRHLKSPGAEHEEAGTREI